RATWRYQDLLFHDPNRVWPQAAVLSFCVVAPRRCYRPTMMRQLKCGWPIRLGTILLPISFNVCFFRRLTAPAFDAPCSAVERAQEPSPAGQDHNCKWEMRGQT